MLIYKFGFFVLPATYLLTLCSHLSNATKFLDSGLIILYITSGIIVGKIIYDRFQQIKTLSSTVTNVTVTKFANNVASFSAVFLFLGFLMYFFLFLFRVNSYYLTALNIFTCAFGTLYLWMHCIITNHVSSLYYDNNLMILRYLLAKLSSLIIIIMVMFGIVSIFVSGNILGAYNGIYICFFATSLCCYVFAAIFCVFLLSFEVDTNFFSQGLGSNFPFDDSFSFHNSALSESESLFTAQPSTIIIRGSISSMKVS